MIVGWVQSYLLYDLLEPTFLQGAGEMLLGGLELDCKDDVVKINPT